MKYWVLAISLLLLGCGGGESDEAAAKNAGEEIADTLTDAQDAAANVEKVLQDAQVDVDAAIEAAEQGDED